MLQCDINSYSVSNLKQWQKNRTLKWLLVAFGAEMYALSGKDANKGCCAHITTYFDRTVIELAFGFRNFHVSAEMFLLHFFHGVILALECVWARLTFGMGSTGRAVKYLIALFPTKVDRTWLLVYYFSSTSACIVQCLLGFLGFVSHTKTFIVQLLWQLPCFFPTSWNNSPCNEDLGSKCIAFASVDCVYHCGQPRALHVELLWLVSNHVQKSKSDWYSGAGEVIFILQSSILSNTLLLCRL